MLTWSAIENAKLRRCAHHGLSSRCGVFKEHTSVRGHREHKKQTVKHRQNIRTECVSPRVVVGLPTMLGTHPRELLCGTNAYDLLAEGWVDENVTSQNDGGLVDPTPSTRKGTLNLDEDVDNAINVSSNAVVSVGKIKVVF